MRTSAERDGLHPLPLRPLPGRLQLGAAAWRWSGGTSSIPKKNPFFEFGEVELFLARRDGEVVGRIAAVSNPRYNEFHGTNAGFFGLFECVNDAGGGPSACSMPRRRGCAPRASSR